MAATRAEILIEGYTREELLALPRGTLEDLVAYNRPIVFKVGSATLLGQVRVERGALIVEIAHVDGGGEGVLPTLSALAPGIAKKLDLARVASCQRLAPCTSCPSTPTPTRGGAIDRLRAPPGP
jgi:hypothetical protein